MPRISISIDGPTASGKTTLATGLAQTLGLSFLDTGLTYRSLAYALTREPAERLRSELGSVLEHRPVVYDKSVPGRPVKSHGIFLHGEEITEKIWDVSLDDNLKAVAKDPVWRQLILCMHQDISEEYENIVAVGRDVAVTLLPTAHLQIYLTASLAVRKERRRAQYRDMRDRSATVGPATARDVENRAAVRALPNSLEIQSTYLPASAVLACALNRLENKKGATTHELP